MHLAFQIIEDDREERDEIHLLEKHIVLPQINNIIFGADGLSKLILGNSRTIKYLHQKRESRHKH